MNYQQTLHHKSTVHCCYISAFEGKRHVYLTWHIYRFRILDNMLACGKEYGSGYYTHPISRANKAIDPSRAALYIEIRPVNTALMGTQLQEKVKVLENVIIKN